MIRMPIDRPTVLAMAITLSVTGCATIDKQVAESDSWVSCAGGGLLGALAGAAIGATQGGSDKVLLGAVAGAAVGCGGGLWYKDRVDRLQKIAKEEGLKMQVRELQVAAVQEQQKPKDESSTAVGLEASIEYAEMFPVGSANLTTEGHRKMTRVAQEFASKREEQSKLPENQRRKVLVVGHTDSAGAAQFNQRLSEERARAMGQILAAAGVPRSDIYYQGAGSSRPIASNDNEDGRAQNRRVELVEVQNEALLVKRVSEERASPKYLAHGTGSASKVALASTTTAVTQKTMKAETTPAKSANATESTTTATAPLNDKPVAQPKSGDVLSPSSTASESVAIKLAGKGTIDFGGHLVADSSSPLTGSIAPKTPTFSIITPAYASAPISSCIGDMPRVEGQVKNLANGQPLAEHSTEEYFPGLNGKPWVAAVNGHVASVGPVAVLRDEAKVAKQPAMQFIPDYKKSKKQTAKIESVANTYEGETQILYRVFAVNQAASPVSCMDVVFDKRSGAAVAGEIYYPKQGDAYVAQYLPKRR
ncbi:porin [Aeromonas sobria]|nr:porin [Aeromonas sobria]